MQYQKMRSDSIAARHASHVALFGNGGVEAGAASEVLSSDHLRTAYAAPLELTRDAHGHLFVDVLSQENEDA